MGATARVGPWLRNASERMLRAVRLGLLLAATGLAPSWAAVGPCLKNYAQSQARFKYYDLAAYDAALTPAVAPVAMSFQDVTPTVNEAAADDRTALSLYQLSTERLLDWNKWPSRRLAFGTASAEFMGVHLTDKDAEQGPCIRTMFRLFAPRYLEDAGFSFLASDYEQARVRRIKVSSAFASTAAYEFTEHFYVINLTRLRSTDYWKKRYADFIKNVGASGYANAPPVYLERFLLNVLRLERYRAPRMNKFERPKFIAASLSGLEKRNIRCSVQRDHPACVLNAVFMETELGSAHPLAVTDALDNSGLAFGPRQLDLGQDRKDANEFAMKYLLEPEDIAAHWNQKYFRPIEQLRVNELKELYASVIPKLNTALEQNGGAVLSLYLDGIVAMAEDNYGLDKLSLTQDGRLLAQVVVADFSNKWGRPEAVASVAMLRNRDQAPLDACGFLTGWHEAIQRKLRPGDLADAQRRDVLIQQKFVQLRLRTATCSAS